MKWIKKSQSKGGAKPGSKPGGSKPGKSKRGKAKGLKTPSSPAQSGMLVPGPKPKVVALKVKNDGESDSDKWSDLSPTQKEDLVNLMRARKTEKRSDQIGEYHKKIAEGVESEE